MKLLHLIWLVPLSVMMSMMINHLANTLPIYRKIIFSPLCPHCGKKINLIHYLINGSCPDCKNPIPRRNTFLTIVFIITYVLIFYFPPAYSGVTISLIIVTFLSLIFVIDYEHRLILHPVSIFGAFLFFILGIILNGWKVSLLGGGIGFLFMYLLYLFGILFSRWISKRKGISSEEVALGYGDVNLSAILGLLLGWPRIAVLLFLAIVFGGTFSALYMVILKIQKKYQLFTAIPYAPFMIISTLVLLYISTPQ